ncbi:Adipocyte plasma membrane-associated protein [Aphelenchoides fujianensis]|nr:Adipocyte plasma membrane-associated protein [Aphelenchoides fujianensis]
MRKFSYSPLLFEEKKPKKKRWICPFCLLPLLLLLVPIAWITYRLLTQNFDPQYLRMPPPRPLQGALAANQALEGAAFIAEGELPGPESLVVEGDTIYTGTWDGRLVKLVNGTIERTIRLGENRTDCIEYENEPKCGRPMGIRRLNGREFVVVDAYLGVFVVDFESGDSRLVLSPTTPIDGLPPRFLNDVDVLNEETIFVSHSTAKFDRRRFLHVFMEQQPNGRLFEVNVTSGAARVLLGGLRFPNGVQIHPDRQSVLVAETSIARIKRHYFAGEWAGRSRWFAVNLPGYPDNLRLSPRGTLLVGLQNARLPDRPQYVDIAGRFPFARRLLVAALPARFVKPAIGLLAPHYGLAVELDAEGTIVRSFHDPSGRISDISQVGKRMKGLED